MIYLAAPYFHLDNDIIQHRMEKVYSFMASRLKQGEHILTPLAMHEVVIRQSDIPNDFEYWGKYCLDLLSRCDKMIVLKLPGWEASRGVSQEIFFCIKHGIPIEYVSEETF